MRREGGQYSLLRGHYVPTNKTLRSCESCWRGHLEDPLRGKLDIHQFDRLNNNSRKNKTNHRDNTQCDDDSEDDDEPFPPELFVHYNSHRIMYATLTFVYEDGKGKFPHKDILIRYLRRCKEKKEVVDADEFLASIGMESRSNGASGNKKQQRRH
ncbi:hypothetical protein HK102_008438, partial [Quaeritorhiza haematococci]